MWVHRKIWYEEDPCKNMFGKYVCVRNEEETGPAAEKQN